MPTSHLQSQPTPPQAKYWRCRCGEFKAQISGEGKSSHVVCYCRDCQAFAHFLGRETAILNPQGGSSIVQIAHHRIKIEQGAAQLAIMRLSPKGLFRWYSRCCHTALGNSLADSRGCFLGMISDSLEPALVAEFGPPIAALATASAICDSSQQRPAEYGLYKVLWNFAGLVLHSRISGAYQQSQLFDSAIVGQIVPKVLTLAERQAVTPQHGLRDSS